MELNYLIIGLVVLALIILLTWFLRRNRRDRKELERTINMRDINPEEHKPEE